MQVSAGAVVPLRVCVCVWRVLLEQTLQHGRGVRGPGLFVLYGLFKVLDAVAAFPDLLKLTRQDLRPPLPGQAGLLQTQLTHLHVVFAWAGNTVIDWDIVNIIKAQ